MLLEATSRRGLYPQLGRITICYLCRAQLQSYFIATSKVLPTEVLTEYNDAECCCKPEKVVIPEGVQVAEPVEQVITQLVEELVRSPEEAVPIVPLPLAGEDLQFQLPFPYLSPVQSPAQLPPVWFPFQFQFMPPASRSHM